MRIFLDIEIYIHNFEVSWIINSYLPYLRNFSFSISNMILFVPRVILMGVNVLLGQTTHCYQCCDVTENWSIIHFTNEIQFLSNLFIYIGFTLLFSTEISVITINIWTTESRLSNIDAKPGSCCPGHIIPSSVAFSSLVSLAYRSQQLKARLLQRWRSQAFLPYKKYLAYVQKLRFQKINIFDSYRSSFL